MSSKGKTGKYRGSVKDFPNFDANQDAEALYNAMKGFGSDKEAILDLITSRSSKQRIEICQAYKSLYGKDLIADLKYELTGKFERLIVGLMRPLEYFDAKEIKDALKGIGTDEKSLIEILASRTNQQIRALVEAYKDAYERNLEEDVIADTSGHFKKMLIVLLQGTREEDDVVSEDLVEQDAKDLLDAGEVKWGTDEAQFIYILGNRSKLHLRLDCHLDAYKIVKRNSSQIMKNTGWDLIADLKSEIGGALAKVILGLMMTPAQYDAKQLKKAMEGAGTDESILIEILATRTNQEIEAINAAYQEAYHKSLEDALSSDTSGHFKRILISLALGNRDEGGVDLAKAHEDAKVVAETLKLADVSSDDSTSLETRFLSILCTQSYPQLRKVFQEFIKMTNHDVAHAINKRMSGDVRDAFLAIVRSVKNKQAFFADKLYKSMKGAGTDDRTLIRIIVSRSEIDLLNIRREFWDLFDKSLYHMMEKDTSGDYRKALLAICGGED
ncbi:annexin A6 [Sphaerodactylus townsendi]|uniref:annexin A6 n=1 Tax=Sphaerodactylus townsendi TaxID=933632 RepID=UPI0020260F42|nr:annexin A6 [Sphaerodactylus townsendi]